MSIINLKSIYLGLWVWIVFQLAPQAKELVESGNRNRFPSTSSEEKTPSSDFENHTTIQKITLPTKEHDPLEDLCRDKELLAFFYMDKNDYENGAKYFFLTTQEHQCTLGHLLYGGLYETSLLLSGTLYEKSHKLYRRALINSNNLFLAQILQRAFDRVTARHLQDEYKIKLNYFNKTQKINPKKIKKEPYNRFHLKEYSEYLNQFYNHYEMFQKVEDILNAHNIVFSKFFRIINFPGYKGNKSYAYIWDGFKDRFPQEFAHYQELASSLEPLTHPLSIDIRNLSLPNSFDAKDPLGHFQKKNLYVYNGLSELNQKNYDRAFVLFFHDFVSKTGPNDINLLAQFAMGEIFEIGGEFIPKDFKAAFGRYKLDLLRKLHFR